MKKIPLAILCVLTVAGPAWPQRVVTEAKIPDSETRRRLGLDLLWQTKIPMIDVRDGLFTVQMLPWKAQPQMLVQTLSGRVYLIDAESGDVIWRAMPPGTIRGGMFAAAFNSHSIYIVRGEWLDVLSRETGEQKQYTWDQQTRLKRYGFHLKLNQIPGIPPPIPPRPPLDPPIAAPVADEELFIYTSGTKIICFAMPDYDFLASRPPPPPKKDEPPRPPPDPKQLVNPPQPIYMWMLILAKSTVNQFPIVTSSQVALLQRDGIFLSLEKFEDKVRYRFRAQGGIRAAAAQFNEFAYFGAEDQAVYAMDAENGTVLWRSSVLGGPILRKPYCNDRDVFVKADKAGFCRLDRNTGEKIWDNKLGHAFLAANRMFVYTRDTHGKLLIHDYVRGTVLATYDMSNWQVNVANEWTDRMYFANHDGQIICMHHHDYPQFQRMKSQDWKIKRKIIKQEKKKQEMP